MKIRASTIVCSAAGLLLVLFLTGADPGPHPTTQWEYGIYIDSTGFYDWQEAKRRVQATNPTQFFEKMGFPTGIEVDARTGRLPALALNHLGQQGWELVEVHAAEAGRHVYWLKRVR